MAHLEPEQLIALAEAPEAPRPPHVAECPDCRRELAAYEETFRSLRGCDVPEPSPLYWDLLSQRVGEAIRRPVATRPVWRPLGTWRWALGSAFAVALVVLTAGLLTRDREPPAVPAGPASEQADASDPELLGETAEVLLGDGTAETAWELVAELAATLENGDLAALDEALSANAVERVLDELTEDQQEELRQLLEQAVSGRSSS